MGELTFTDRLIEAIARKRSILNVGLDPQLRYMPRHLSEWAVSYYGKTFEAVGRVFSAFNRQVINAIDPYAISVKPQIAFYEGYGQWGIWAFEDTISYAKRKGLIVITDAKRGDGGDTAEAYAQGHIGKIPFFGDGETLGEVESPIRVDALTVQPWIGSSCLVPFLTAVKRYGTGVFVVDKTSFAPNSEIEQIVTQSGLRNWEALAEIVSELGQGTEGKYGYRNFGVVMGATYPEDAPIMRKILPNSWFLVPGYGGPQGGGADGAVVAVNDDGFGCVVNSSRGVTYAYHTVSKSQFQCGSEHFAEAAAKAAQFARDELNAALKKAGKLNF